MFKLTKVALMLSAIIFLAGCDTDTSLTPDTTPSETNNTEALIGGTAEHPKELEFDKPYLVTPELGKKYVKVNVDKYQRIVIERVADKECYLNGYFSTLYDETLQTEPLYSYGATQNYGYGEVSGIHDLIFLKGGTYIFEYHFPGKHRLHRSNNCTLTLLTARNMGISSLEKVVNKGKYSYHHYGDWKDFYLLEMKNDGVVNFNRDGGSPRAILYDDDLNIIENINLYGDTLDINVSLSQGNYLLRPTNYEIMVTFNP